MYLDHFGLREAPFRITPHTEFFFAGANRGATLEALMYAITQDEGIVKVTGEVGSGKTMLCRMLLEKLPINVETVYLANPSLSRQEILHAIAAELKAPLPDDQTHLLQKSVMERLIDIHATGRQVVVLIDEAHAMPPETLEEIRLLSNLETNRHKLLHIALFGQPELDERLDQTTMRQLKERITHNFGLEPLRRNDIGSYLMFRMRAAGYKGPDLFTAGALQLVTQASEGLTRRINILADKALLSAFSESTHQIDRHQVKAAIRDAQFKPMRDRRTRRNGWLVGVGLVLLASGLAYAWQNRLFASRAPVASIVPVAETTAVPIAPIAPPTTAAPPVDSAPAAPATTVASAPVEPVALAPATAPVVAVETVAAPMVTNKPAIETTPATTPTVPQAPDEPSAAQPTAAAEAPPPTFAERLQATEEWLARTPDHHYFIQLVSTAGGNPHDVELFLETEISDLDPQQVRVYRSSLSGRERLGVIYGDFASHEAASKELSRIYLLHPGKKAYVRAVSKLR